MKLIRVGILAAALFTVSAASAQTKTVGYDIGSCSPDSFAAAHIEYTEGKSFTLTSYSPGPNVVKVPSQPDVYSYTSKDKDGFHYVDDRKLEIVIAKANDKVIVGKLIKAGEVVSVIFGFPADGKQLAENAKKEFQQCQDINAEPDTDDNSKTSDDKHRVIREDESKT